MNSNTNTLEFWCNDLYIDYRSRLVKINEQEVTLTRKEYGLLKELTQNAGIMLSHTHLLQTIWGPEYTDERQFLHQYICYLRKKIEPDPRSPRYIHTLPREGYIFRLKE